MSNLPTPEQFAEELLIECCDVVYGGGGYEPSLELERDTETAAILIASRDRALLAPFVALADECDSWANAAGMGGSPDGSSAYNHIAGALRAAITAARGEQEKAP